ncbi:MAG: prepilin-type N-terminal cleavage/methylation domain-containing protein [Patescibacteria group bacterium]
MKKKIYNVRRVLLNHDIFVALRSSKGFTLIEFLITFAVILAVGGGIVVFQRDLFVFNSYIGKSLSIGRDAERVVRDIVREVRSASQSSIGAYPIEIAKDNEFIFFANIDKGAERERIHYYLSGDELKRSIIYPTGQPLTYSTTTGAQESVRTVLRNIISTTTPIFTYYNNTYAGTTTPLTQPVPVLNIRVVGIMITVDEVLNQLPPPLSFSSKVTIRNLRDNP